MKQTYGLSRPFDVSRGSFGGSQMWYQDSFDLQTGCGPVALANLFAWFNGLALDQAEMTALQETVTRYLKGPVVAPWQFIRGARHLFRRDGFSLDPIAMTILRHSPAVKNRAKGFIAASLRSDDPAVLLMGPNRPGAAYRTDFRNHWVVITAMTVEAGSITLTVSSWGGLFEVDLDQLIRSKLFLSLVSLRVKEGPEPPDRG